MQLGTWTELVAGIATLLAIVVALFHEPLLRSIRQMLTVASIVDVSEIDQGNQLKTRLKIRNNGPWSDHLKV